MTARLRALRPFLPVIGLGLLMLLASGLAESASSRAGIRKTVENSMLVTGTIDIGADGTTTGHALDQPDKLPPVVRELVAKAATGFRFEPVLVEGKPAPVRAKMGLRVVATRVDSGDYRLRVASASFDDDRAVKGEDVTSLHVVPPAYPPAAYRSGVAGTVYTVVKIDATGAVVDVAVEQTNLTVTGSEWIMAQARALLEKSAIDAARKWRFDVPTRGPKAAQASWSMRLPIDYILQDGAAGDPATPYGKWQSYVPGPRNHIPWISEDDNRARPDALVAGAAHPVGDGPKLLTPLPG